MNLSEQRFTHLVQAAGSRILSYLTRRVDPPCDGADLLADTLTVAWRRIADLPGDDDQAMAWLFGIARGVLANHRRGQTRRAALADRLRARLADRPPGPDPSGETVAIRDALNRLPDPDRELITLTAWDGLTADEVAAVLEITPAAVRQRLVRARGRLRAALLEHQAPAPPA
ncbi:sigma-70 family RNA polymerase sigma factor [Micromonospora sp. NPDC006766]|uniref:RNA polymerase sigma factor n=1 Tax=Micromonospora sp. NPDC006766 TaxID=3154778 RepID=UPI0033D07A68